MFGERHLSALKVYDGTLMYTDYLRTSVKQ